MVLEEERDILDAIIMLISEKDASERISARIKLKKIDSNAVIEKPRLLKETEHYLEVWSLHDKYFRCKICDSRYSYIRVMEKHLRKDHNIDVSR